MSGRPFKVATSILAAMTLVSGCSDNSSSSSSREVVIYTSVDEVFARPIAERFEEETGITEPGTTRGGRSVRVRPVVVKNPHVWRQTPTYGAKHQRVAPSQVSRGALKFGDRAKLADADRTAGFSTLGENCAKTPDVSHYSSPGPNAI